MTKETIYAFQNICVGREIKGRRQRSSGSYSKCSSTTLSLTNPPSNRAEKQLIISIKFLGEIYQWLTNHCVSFTQNSIHGQETELNVQDLIE